MNPEDRDAIYQHNADDPLMIIYHDDADGFGAAMVAVRVLGRDAVQLVPVHHGDLPPEVAGRNVRMFDCTFERALMENMAELAKSFIVFDHHETAEMECRGLDFCRFDMEKSAVRMAWEYYYPDGVAPVEWVRLIEDRDLWRFEFGDTTRNFLAFLRTFPRTIDGWQTALAHSAEESDTMGRGVRAYQTQLFESIARQGSRIDWSGFKAIVVNTGTMCSDVCHRMLEIDEIDGGGAVIAICYYRTKAGLWHHELRTRKDAGPHVGHLARILGGGGDRDAAGFVHEGCCPSLPETKNEAATKAV